MLWKPFQLPATTLSKTQNAKLNQRKEVYGDTIKIKLNYDGFGSCSQYN